MILAAAGQPYLIIATLFLAYAAVWWLTPLVIKLYRCCGWDKPHQGERQKIKDTHVGNLPRGGGLAIGGGLFAVIIAGAIIAPAYFLFPWVGEELAATHDGLQLVLSIYVGALIFIFLGWGDDVRDLSPLFRLGVNVVVALLLWWSGLSIDFVTNPLGSGVWHLNQVPFLAALLTVIYFVAMVNITNWAKGVDGQLPGVVVIAAIFISVVSFRLTGKLNYNLLLGALVAGGYAGFLHWNFFPQKILPGFGAGALAGYFLAVLSILVGAKLATLFMVLALPIADAIFTILRRIHAGKSIFLGDRGHLHHKLLDKLGWSRRQIALFYYAVTLIMGVLALLLPTGGKIIAFALVLLLVFYFLIWVKLHP